MIKPNKWYRTHADMFNDTYRLFKIFQFSIPTGLHLSETFLLTQLNKMSAHINKASLRVKKVFRGLGIWLQSPGREQCYFPKAKTVGLIAIFFISFLLSCDKSSQPQLPPTIQVQILPGSSNSDSVFAVGDLINFEISAQSRSASLTNLYSVKKPETQGSGRTLDTSMNIQQFSFNKTFVKGLDKKETWTFIVRDKNRMADSVSMNIYLDSTSGFGPVSFLESVVMSAQNLNDPGSFFSIEAGVFNLNQATQNQESIDLLYYYFGEDENVIASPGANIESGVFEGDLLNWETRRTTRFIELELPSDDFYAAENDSLLLVSYQEGSGKRKAKNLSAGKIFSFKTQDSKFGIFRVIEVEGTDAGKIKIDIKIQDK